MGLFSAKKTISVSSTLYNLAGAIENRVQYLPSVIASKVVSGTAPSIGEAIQNSLFNGPGMRFRNYARWTRTAGYASALGIVSGKLSIGNDIDLEVLAATIPHAADEVVAIQSAEIGIADYGFWADQWMSEHHPDQLDADYVVDFDEVTNVISITFTAGPVYTFSPVGFDPKSRYLYVSYLLTKGRSYSGMVYGNKTSVGSPAEWPSIAKYILVSDTPTAAVLSATDTVVTDVTYSDNRPPESNTVSTPKTLNYTNQAQLYRYEEPLGLSLLRLSTNSRIHFTTRFTEGVTVPTTTTDTMTEVIADGVTKTTKKTTTKWTAGPSYAYREDYQDSVISSWSTIKVMIYKQNDGIPTYDAFFVADVDMGEFVPFIPLRLRNNFLSEEYLPDIYELSKKAAKRALDKKYDFLIDQLADNEKLGDIDFAYISFGVSLNTKENACKKYIYKFFQLLNQSGAGGSNQYNQWKVDWETAHVIQTRWVTWRDAQANPANPLFGSPEPDKATYPQMPTRNLAIISDITGYNMNMWWSGISEIILNGQAPSTSKVGDVTIKTITAAEYHQLMVSGGITDIRPITDDGIGIYWQDTTTTHRVIAVTGLAHANTIYKGKNVGIFAGAALADPDESGFLVPLHEGVYRSISLKDATQMATACSYMVLNSYTVTKEKWYASSWFKVVLIIVIIVITILTGGAGAALGAGVLGTAAGVGAAIGLTGVAAVVAGAALNAIAGMVIAQLITAVATKLLGPKLGPIVGAIASVLVLSVGTSIASGGTAAQGLANMSSSLNILKMTVATVNGATQALQSELGDVQHKIEEVQKNYQNELTNIYNSWSENLGFNKSTIDVSELTSAVSTQFESSDSFLSRTLLTGSEIADLTNGLIGALADVTLSTELPT